MKITRLRIAGFKSFVDQTDVLVEPGLSGIVGPNGCGKSNLVEALRFVMGETSFKAMRGSGMDDVIFAGSANRPARNTAEVSLAAIVDAPSGAARGASGKGLTPTGEVEITRRIEREQGSIYRLNGREVRARDVQLLFADAATGARSSALVRQGQIGELIAAKPKDRRSILEDAAGISGLHSRRHEAELKLRAAEQNLERLEDVIGEIGGQLEALKRQARQAARYRNLSFDIRKAEAQLALIRIADTEERLTQAEAALTKTGMALAKAAEEQAKAAREEAVAGSGLPQLREKAAAAGAAVQHLKLKAEELRREAARREARLNELSSRQRETEADIAREGEHQREAAEAAKALSTEAKALERDKAGAAKREAEAATKAEAAGQALASAEEALSAAQGELATKAAERRQHEMRRKEAEGALSRLAAEADKLTREEEALRAEAGSEEKLAAARASLKKAEAALKKAEATAQKDELATAKARAGEAEAREKRSEALRALTALKAEADALSKLLKPLSEGDFTPVMESVTVEPGYEAALAAALGEDLDASSEKEAPISWRARGKIARAPKLPAGAKPLSDFVSGEACLDPRLSQIGVVESDAGDGLVARLAVGQRLVSKDGALWRWDGLTIRGGTKTPAAARLEQKNRLGALAKDIDKAEKAAAKAEAALQQACEKRAAGEEAERTARNALKEARSGRDRAQTALTEAERQLAREAERRSVLAASLSRNAADRAGQQERLAAANEALALHAADEAAEAKVAALLEKVGEARRLAADARAAAESLRHAARAREERLAALARDRAAWEGRGERAEKRVSELQARLADLGEEIETLSAEPEDFLTRERAFLAEIRKAEEAAKEESDRLAAAESGHRGLAEAARHAIEALSAAREAKARDEERASAIRTKRDELTAEIASQFHVKPDGLREEAGLKRGAPMPELAATEQRHERLLRERERLGGVNLRAEEEAKEVEARLENLTGERDDLVAAIRRLRQAVGSLNREGRERLLAAFREVDRHFQALFHTLFGGGSAELMLTESDDPLEAGLEVMARPPGKKPQIMTLLSGGEQALTAMALIFAVFLTNPSPVCVLDEVDAPLDDANVERFCDLLEQMRENTDTRFLVVTHNPITMARMDRLFGVTMAERGVSQLVSVDLETAERFREVG
ncbi:chromosome segregation protein SMC [Afifella sp. IM 167]|uniref:chromosome segregation protein SMC n=1 Tax=Afifella sp. IM 167 TaxID=2033586 RepID=UPI001CCFA02B|nr:chromosome segregation protein SMC [Afifella sp. IM 167]MBZ8133355.1 chromosome segregation protein SMC [Afifella sp. IM 167]